MATAIPKTDTDAPSAGGKPASRPVNKPVARKKTTPPKPPVQEAPSAKTRIAPNAPWPFPLGERP